tara:strand:- start:254 stop:388 length:135 start_codon:yes stop_codon:yes gene_type:complete
LDKGSHQINPKDPAVKPTPQKNANSKMPCADGGISNIFDFKRVI